MCMCVPLPRHKLSLPLLLQILGLRSTCRPGMRSMFCGAPRSTWPPRWCAASSTTPGWTCGRWASSFTVGFGFYPPSPRAGFPLSIFPHRSLSLFPAEALFGRPPFASRSFAELEEKIRSDRAVEVIWDGMEPGGILQPIPHAGVAAGAGGLSPLSLPSCPAGPCSPRSAGISWDSSWRGTL